MKYKTKLTYCISVTTNEVCAESRWEEFVVAEDKSSSAGEKRRLKTSHGEITGKGDRSLLYSI